MIDALAGKKIAVLMGGTSAEREVSVSSGSAVVKALAEAGYDVHGLSYDGPGVVAALMDMRPDVVFIALHGRHGEDGAMQGLLEILALPYTGTGVEGSALAMDKIATKEVLSHRGIKTAPFAVVEKTGGDALKAAESIGYPLVVKPATLGSTIGMSFVYSPDELPAALELAFSHDRDVLMERFVEGRELTVGILGGTALPLVEVIAPGGVYDYNAKYKSHETRYVCPAEVGEDTVNKLQKIALEVFRALKGYGMSRVDFRVDGSGEAWVLEMNTIPGLTGTSLLPKAAAATGIGFTELVERMLVDALKRYDEQV